MKSNSPLAIWDGDLLVYSCAFAGEKRSIIARHLETGNEYELANRTSMYGRKKSKDGGWLAEQNAGRDTPWRVEDFEIIDVQHPPPISHVLQNVKTMVEKSMSKIGSSNIKMFHGEAESFRVGLSTMIGYKQNRQGLLMPTHKQEVIEYLKKKYNSEPCTYLEADDMLICTATEYKNSVVLSHDKDAKAFHVQVFNPTKMEEGVVDCRCFGDIWVEEKVSATTGKKYREVKGYGRKFFWHQVNFGDSSDHYFAAAASETEWGEMSSFKSLQNCTNDLECMKAIVETYKFLYPEPREVYSWRNEIIRVDWKYTLSEVFTMARMLRKVDEKITAEEVFSKYNLWD